MNKIDLRLSYRKLKPEMAFKFWWSEIGKARYINHLHLVLKCREYFIQYILSAYFDVQR